MKGDQITMKRRWLTLLLVCIMIIQAGGITASAQSNGNLFDFDFFSFYYKFSTGIKSLLPSLDVEIVESNIVNKNGKHMNFLCVGEQISDGKVDKENAVARFRAFDEDGVMIQGDGIAKIYGTVSTLDAQYALGTLIVAICSVDDNVGGEQAQNIGVELFGKLADDTSGTFTHAENGFCYSLYMNPLENNTVVFEITKATESSGSSTTTSIKPTINKKDETAAQKNALRMAKDYLAYSAFSYKSLVAQLEYEKFSHDDAVYAVENCGANWNEEAARCAKQYLDFSAFSRDSLIDQLEYEGFTHEQAEYGVEQNGF